MLQFDQSIQQAIVLGITLMVILLLSFEKFRPAAIFFGAVLVFLLTGVVETKDFSSAISNESILSIFLLIFITTGIRDHFNIVGWLDKLFGKTNNPRSFMLRMTTGVTAMSAFMNNTPLVAMMMPYVDQWAKRNNVSRSKLLIPLSYTVISGGMITVIGTSTNMVLNGLIQSKNQAPLGLTDYFFPGIMVSIAGIFFLYFFGYKLLPERSDPMKAVARQSREYLVETKIRTGSSIIGKSIIDAHLRNLTGIYLFEIVRAGKLITPVHPGEILCEGDSLFFAGETQTIAELLESNNGLSLPQSNSDSANQKRPDLIETVIPVNSALTGKTLKQMAFRENYDAAVVAIHRNGEKLRGKIGEIQMQAGDLLLIAAGKNFRKYLNANPDLYLVSVISKPIESTPVARNIFVIIAFLLIAGMVAGMFSLFLALAILAAAMVALKLLSISEVKKQFDMDLLIILVSSLTFSTAIIKTGSAAILATNFISLFKGLGNVGIVVGLFLVTLILTSFITHVATVSIVFPIAYGIGKNLPGIDMSALFMAIAFAASASFHSPFSYQTNLMIYGPGGYKLRDFLKVGLPYTLLYSVISILFIITYYKV
jgi:di/tricarboxylate transporter